MNTLDSLTTPFDPWPPEDTHRLLGSVDLNNESQGLSMKGTEYRLPVLHEEKKRNNDTVCHQSDIKMWTYVERKAHPNGSAVQSVAVEAIVQDEVPQQEFLLLTVQDSIPLQSRVVGFPNGTLNEGETARDGALRMLEEQTGITEDHFMIEFKGSPISTSSSAGMINDELFWTHVIITGYDSQKGFPRGTGNKYVMLLLSVLKSECAQNGYNVASMCTKYAKGFFVAQESFQKESGGKKNKSTAHGPSLDQVIQDDITAPFSERESKISVECGTPNTLSLNNTGKHKMFLDLKCTEYTDKLTGASSSCYYASRVPLDGQTAPRQVVSIDAILRDEALGTMKTVLIAIQRIPLGPGKTVIGFPAGLLDANESAEKAALREFREESGYSEATVISSKADYAGATCPSLADECVHHVSVECRGRRSEQSGGEPDEIIMTKTPYLDQGFPNWVKDSIEKGKHTPDVLLTAYTQGFQAAHEQASMY